MIETSKAIDRPFYWMMRTSREGQNIRTWLLEQLEAGSLRQGWGWDDTHDLRLLKPIMADKTLSKDERNRLKPHWIYNQKMLGLNAPYPTWAIQKGDIILLPNLPNDGAFMLVRITGDYEYRSGFTAAGNDFRHHLPCEILQKNVNRHGYNVHQELRRATMARQRLSCLNDFCLDINSLIDNKNDDLSAAEIPVSRALKAINDVYRAGGDDVSAFAAVSEKLYAAEWEAVISNALMPLFNTTVIHTGGPNENGRDIEVRIANPFSPTRPFLIKIQVRNHEGISGAENIKSLERAAQYDKEILIALVLLLTHSKPSADLETQALELEKQTRIPVLIAGPAELTTILKGLIVSG